MFLLNLLLALAWVALTGIFTPSNFLAGFVLGYFAVAVGVGKTTSSNYLHRVVTVFTFVAFFLWELIRASIRVAFDIVTPQNYMKPGVIAVPLDVHTDEEITLLANLITLTPGSLTLDISADHRFLFVHEMYIPDVEKARRAIKQKLESRVMRVMR